MKRLAKAAEAYLWSVIVLKWLGIALAIAVYAWLYQTLKEAGAVLGL